MFNWTTTTLINELPKIFSEKNGAALRIGKHLFEKRWVESIRKAKGHDYELCEAKLNLNEVDRILKEKYTDAARPSVARLFIYVGLDGSEESIYANDWYRKGMPLSVSFVVDTPEKMAKAIVDTVKTFNVFTKVKKVLDVEVKEGEENKGMLYIKGTHEHQRLQKIQVLVDAGFGEEVAVVNYELNRREDAAVAKADVKVGKNGFGTFHQLSKDLRLPTAVHNHWLSVQKDEMPIVGAIYTQYIISYYAPSTANPSFTAVGNRSMSETTHVFWVKNDLVEAWETAIAAIDPDGGNFDTIKGKVEGNFANKAESLVERVENLEKE